MLVLKLNYNGELRRVTLTEDPKPDYALVEKHIREAYADSVLGEGSFVLKYVDDEDDSISISCEHDLREAILFCKLSGNTTLRVDIHPVDKKLSPDDQSSSEEKGALAALEALLPTREEWNAKAVNIRGRFKGIVDAVHKLGTMLQKKHEEKCLPAACTPDEEKKLEENNVVSVTVAQEETSEPINAENAVEEAPIEEEKEKEQEEKEREEKPRVVVSVEGSCVAVAYQN